MNRSFTLLVAAFTALIGLGQLLVFNLLSLDWNWVYLILYVYFPAFSLIMHAILTKKIDQRPQAFVTAFMGSMSAKLFISLILLLVVLYTNREIKIPFAILFMIFYAVFTILSTSVLFKKLRSKKE